ncbi:MAG: hypothetical protein ACOCV8_00285 [Spirochaetota bacterium]
MTTITIEEIKSLISAKIYIDMFNTIIYTILILIILYLFIKLFLKQNINKNPELKFRINSERVYSILTIISETFYILAISFSIILLILLTNLNLNIQQQGIYTEDMLLSNSNVYTISGIIILIFLSLPFKIFFSKGRSKLLSYIYITILIISLTLIIIGIIYGSLTHFDYIIN